MSTPDTECEHTVTTCRPKNSNERPNESDAEAAIFRARLQQLGVRTLNDDGSVRPLWQIMNELLYNIHHTLPADPELLAVIRDLFG